jgi:tetratricopeptide (TPR) repeat protein
MPQAHWDSPLLRLIGDQFQRTSQIADPEQAIQYHQQALEATPANHSHRGQRVHNLGLGFGDRLPRTSQMTDLEQAIRFFKQVLEAIPADRSDRGDV